MIETKPKDADRAATARFQRTLHPVGRFDPHQVERAGDHRLRRRGQAEPEGLGLALEDAVLVVEAVEIVRQADRVRREGVWAAALGRLGDDSRELGQALDQVALFDGELAGGSALTSASSALRRMPAMRACAYWT